MYATLPDNIMPTYSLSMSSVDVIKARAAYLADPTAEKKQLYIESLEKLYQTHWNSSQTYSRNNPYTAPVYKADGILDAREAAQLTAKFQKNNTRGSGTSSPTLESAYNNAVARLERVLPKVPTSQMTGGKWKQQSAAEVADSILQTLYKARVRQRMGGAPRSAEDMATAKLMTNELLKRMASSPSAMFVSIKNEDTGDIVRAYVNPRSSANSPKIKASPAELAMASDSLAKVRENSNVEHPLTLSLVAASSILPTNEKFRKHDSNTLGYAFAGGGAHIYLDRVAASGAERERGMRKSDDGWWSTEVATTAQAYMHVGVHELGHVVMYKVWGSDSFADKGERQLESDYRKFNVMDNISRYGTKSVAEHFAEAYAKYIITGQATPEFRALLESKNLLKSQKKD